MKSIEQRLAFLEQDVSELKRTAAVTAVTLTNIQEICETTEIDKANDLLSKGWFVLFFNECENGYRFWLIRLTT